MQGSIPRSWRDVLGDTESPHHQPATLGFAPNQWHHHPISAVTLETLRRKAPKISTLGASPRRCSCCRSSWPPLRRSLTKAAAEQWSLRTTGYRRGSSMWHLTCHYFCFATMPLLREKKEEVNKYITMFQFFRQRNAMKIREIFVRIFYFHLRNLFTTNVQPQHPPKYHIYIYDCFRLLSCLSYSIR